ncbi:hypothetical protein FC756_23920 [Lysinibacillus mangiferihumi]|uniref:Uncharacterized protein n=1 Tax=Lysinibacillus mangiferihumi TaxID=1130819 RepID=A0A4U2Y0S7_9BACI|nr:hypothetical protein [Lysinibacillus mangiferihumi]TKI53445.1 hypothetical protein FC756_23920 [Lysinibacillus mangiferihumi]
MPINELSELRSVAFQQEVLNMLQPKIKSVLYQTGFQNRMDLELEISLMILRAVKTKELRKVPSFLELIESEKII